MLYELLRPTTDDQLRRVARSWLESHRWIPETIRTAAPGDLEWQRETLPDHWIEQDAVTGDDHERWPTSKRAFLLQLIERQGYQTSAADADRLQRRWWRRRSEAASHIMPCRPSMRHWQPSESMS